MKKQPNYLKLAKKLISLQTIDGNHEAFEAAWYAIDEVLDTYKYKRYMSNGYESRIYYGNGKMPEQFDVVLNGHLDIVPGDDDLFKPTVIGDKLYGRGAYDMKAALAVQIHVFNQLANQLPIKIGLQITTEEEVGGHNGTKYHFDQGFKTTFGLTGESGSNFAIKNKAKGIFWIKVNFKGISTHAATPWDGDNVLFQAQTFMNQLQAAFPVPHSEAWVTTVTPSNIESNNPALNKIPDKLSLYMDVRFVPEDEEKILPTIKKIAPDNATVEVMLSDGSHNTADDNPYVQSLLKTCQQLDIDSSLKKSHGTGDMRFYTLAGSSGVEFGPVGGGAHNHEEWVSIESLEKYYQVLTNWLSKL